MSDTTWAQSSEIEIEEPTQARHRTRCVKFFATVGVLFAAFVGGALVALIANDSNNGDGYEIVAIQDVALIDSKSVNSPDVFNLSGGAVRIRFYGKKTDVNKDSYVSYTILDQSQKQIGRFTLKNASVGSQELAERPPKGVYHFLIDTNNINGYIIIEER